jgi:hypothetical protein
MASMRNAQAAFAVEAFIMRNSASYGARHRGVPSREALRSESAVDVRQVGPDAYEIVDLRPLTGKHRRA